MTAILWWLLDAGGIVDLWRAFRFGYLDEVLRSSNASTSSFFQIAFWQSILGLLAMLSLASATVRRLHDTNMSGFFVFITMIPLVGPFWLFIQLLLVPGTVGPNKYGPSPKMQRIEREMEQKESWQAHGAEKTRSIGPSTSATASSKPEKVLSARKLAPNNQKPLISEPKRFGFGKDKTKKPGKLVS